MTTTSRSHAGAGAKVIGLPADRLDAACSAGRNIANRLEKPGAVRACPVRREFIETDAPGPTSPPMMFVLRGGDGSRGGQGGEVRLKLYLSMLWLASGPPHDTTHPAYSWARLLGLDDPDGNGKRRVLDAIDWLDANAFLERRSTPGKPATVRLLSDSGTGEPYTKPAGTVGGRPTYRKLEPTWWTNGWLATLSGAAVTIFLAYRNAAGNMRGPPPWITPSVTKNRYGMSNDTRQKGLRELRDWGLITAHRSRQREAFGSDRTIARYALNLDRLATAPTDTNLLLTRLGPAIERASKDLASPGSTGHRNSGSVEVGG